MLRIVLQWVHADFANPVFELVARLTNPPLKPIRRLIPTIMAGHRRNCLITDT